MLVEHEGPNSKKQFNQANEYAILNDHPSPYWAAPNCLYVASQMPNLDCDFFLLLQVGFLHYKVDTEIHVEVKTEHHTASS